MRRGRRGFISFNQVQEQVIPPPLCQTFSDFVSLSHPSVSSRFEDSIFFNSQVVEIFDPPVSPINRDEKRGRNRQRHIHTQAYRERKKAIGERRDKRGRNREGR
ncbi:hypothetical protein HAX54_033697 [Datura stramonium]|uniref:BZIP domain-containing protein n=1 Tax=Datura stramonium TaxID=4076 RepID=A0ABS8VDW3_DATST|nr:hypothetical protein [Datura stramonium]